MILNLFKKEKKEKEMKREIMINQFKRCPRTGVYKRSGRIVWITKREAVRILHSFDFRIIEAEAKVSDLRRIFLIDARYANRAFDTYQDREVFSLEQRA